MKRRIVTQMAIPALSLSAPVLAVAHAPQATATSGNIIHVSAEGGLDTGDGTAARSLQTIGAALKKTGDGDTIGLANGTYRGSELAVDKGMIIKVAEGAKPVLTGAKILRSWSAGGDGRWSTGKDMVRLCTVYTISVDPAREGITARPEQVFVDGKPLTQVLSRTEVAEPTFYVDDPNPVTLKNPKNNQAGYDVRPHRDGSYVIDTDPNQHQVEMVQHSRALSFNTDSITLSGLTVEKYSAMQRWDYGDPEIGTISGGGMVVAARGAPRIENSTSRYSSTAGALQVINLTNAVVLNSLFESNGSNALGINDSSGAKVKSSTWRNNNTSSFIMKDCGAYCTLADTKITHSKNICFASNTTGYPATGMDIPNPLVYGRNRVAGIWFDEGVIDLKTVGNYLVDVPVMIFNETPSNNLTASSTMAGVGIDIHVSGSDDTRVWNNTVSYALTSPWIQEGTHSDGYNTRDTQGAYTQIQKWSAEYGLSWDTTNTKVINNIFFSEQTTLVLGDPWRCSTMVQVLDRADQDDSGAVYVNEMASSIDYGVYHRHENPQTLSTMILWNQGADRMNQSVNVEKLSDFTASSNVRAEGKESDGLDPRGSPEDNPFFVGESTNPMDKTSDLHLKEGSSASGNDHVLPENIAKALGADADAPVDRGALVNVAWGGGTVPDAGDAPADSANNGGKAADNSGKAANNNGSNGGNANNGDKTNNGDEAADNGDKADNGSEADNNGLTTTDGVAGTDGKNAWGTDLSSSRMGAGRKSSGIVKPGGNAQGGQGQVAAAAAAVGDSRLPLIGASMADIVLAVAAVVLSGGFTLVHYRMAG